MPSENAPVLAENTPVPAGNAPVLAENAPARTENAPASADIRTYNRNLLINYFRSGCKPPERCDALGVEVERFVLTEAGKAVGYWPRAGRPGVEQVLAGLEPYYPRASYSEGGALVGLSGSDGSISIEPSAQLELSAAPYHAVAEVGAAFRRFDQHVDALLGPSGARLVAQGYHPSRRALELPLIPKRRYHVMDAYFSHIGSHGERMMRATASTQVSIDYTSEADAVRKLRVAAALAPVLAAIMDNVTVFEARPNELPIRRLNVWRDVDPLRCGTPQGIFDDSFGFAAYADWLLATPPIFVERPGEASANEQPIRLAFDTPAADVYSDAPMSAGDVAHLVSMFWPDVRLKRFVEIRPADSAPLEQVLGYTALVKGLFYSDSSLAAVEDTLGVERGCAGGGASPDRWPLAQDAVDEAIANVEVRGFEASVYGQLLTSWESLLFELAREALPAEERAFLDPLEAFAHNKPWWRPERQL